jgi:hypothetical protein
MDTNELNEYWHEAKHVAHANGMEVSQSRRGVFLLYRCIPGQSASYLGYRKDIRSFVAFVRRASHG